MNKKCCQCKTVKKIEEFQKRSDAKDGRAYFCKECAKIRRKNRQKRYKELSKDVHEKICSICGKLKDIECFWKHATVSDGRRPECKECGSVKAKERSEKYEKFEQISEKICCRCGIIKNIDEFSLNRAKKSQRNGHCKECQKEYLEKNKESISKRTKELRLKNKEYILERERKYREKNREKINENKRIYEKNRKKQDPDFRITASLRNFVHKSISRQCKKERRSFELFGVSIDKIKLWLEMNFEEGMSWDNYGLDGWTIDHIEPCSNFDLSDPEEQKKCMNWSNLTPMWHKDNNAKNNRNLEEFIGFLDDEKYKNLKLRYKISYGKI